jgi:pyridoxamine 5'-phosphate oxidase
MATMATDPFTLFANWYSDAQNDPDTDPDLVALATATADARPSVRMVFYRGVREGGFSFFTNYESRKALEMQSNPYAAMAFYWPRHGRQVRIEGAVERLSTRESDAYFQARPFESQITAIVSRQSRPLQNPEEFRAKLREYEQQFRGKRVPCPESWGGFKILPSAFEFWSRGEFRRHDRTRYELKAGKWAAARLYP